MQVLWMMLVTLGWRRLGSSGWRWCHTLPRGLGAADLTPKPSTALHGPPVGGRQAAPVPLLAC
jgi:hypothetical protein